MGGIKKRQENCCSCPKEFEGRGKSEKKFEMKVRWKMKAKLKQCTKCGGFKECSKRFFYADKTKRDGFRSECKKCSKE